jgi:F0F1-type ATP synthase assembly protein I
MDNPKKKPQHNKWIVLINIPVQMGAIIFFCAYLGNLLDSKYPNPQAIYVKILVLFGVGLAFYNLNRQLKKINDSES